MKRIIVAIILLNIIIIIGAIGYVVIEDWNVFDSLYMTIITIGTVGFHEVGELSHTGRIFTIVLIIVGIGVGGYSIANLSAFIIEGHIQNLVKGKKMHKTIRNLKNHFIVCGYGKTGCEIISEFTRLHKQFVIIENNEHKLNELKNHGYLVLEGDATEDEVLEMAGVKNAHGLIATLSNDADNVYVVLTAREMNRSLRIIARAVDSHSSKKLIRAGADKVVSPYSIAGKRIARMLLSPGIVDFLDVMVQSQELELRIEEVTIHKNSSLVEKHLRESNIKVETRGAMIVGVKQGNGQIMVNPPGDLVLKEGLILYALGNNEQIEKLRDLAG